MDTYKLICLFVIVSQAAALLTSPPRIVKQPTVEELLFQVAQQGEVDKPFIIECEAEGEPAPKYRWIKNGKPFEYSSYDTRISQQPGRGTLVVSKPRDEDLGQYQCFAYNEWGTATSNSVFVRKAELNSFKEADGPQQTITAQEGFPFKLTCEPPDGHPSPNVYWMLQGDQGQLKTINNSRMTLDPEGNLWFSNVTRFDASNDYAYTCAAKSVFRNEYKLGNKVYLEVQQTGLSPALNKHEPVRQYTSRRVEKAWRGKKVELYCIYGGTPLPQIVWKKNGSRILSSQRITQDNYGKTLVIRRAGYEDQGTYTCEVSNGVGTAQTYSIQLNVEAAPFFTEEPQFQNLAEGETAVINCRAGGTPEPQISWVHNGKPIEQAEPNARRQVTANSIIITDLVKKDTGNYGCNATNSNGYVYKDVYINVQLTQCSRCWKFGHSRFLCPSTKYVCPKCTKNHENCKTIDFCCVNCRGNHMALQKICPIFQKEKRIRELMSEFQCTYRKALTLYVPPSPVSNSRPTEEFTSKPKKSSQPNQVAERITEPSDNFLWSQLFTTTKGSTPKSTKRDKNQKKRHTPSTSTPIATTYMETEEQHNESTEPEDEVRATSDNHNAKQPNTYRKSRIQDLSFLQLLIRLKNIILSEEALEDKIQEVMSVCKTWVLSMIVSGITDGSFLSLFKDRT